MKGKTEYATDMRQRILTNIYIYIYNTESEIVHGGKNYSFLNLNVYFLMGFSLLYMIVHTWQFLSIDAVVFLFRHRDKIFMQVSAVVRKLCSCLNFTLAPMPPLSVPDVSAKLESMKKQRIIMTWPVAPAMRSSSAFGLLLSCPSYFSV